MFRSMISIARAAVAIATLSGGVILAQPTSHPGWPVTYSTTGASFVEQTSVQVADMLADGSRDVVISWIALINSSNVPGSVEIRHADGSVFSRMNFERILLSPAFVDRDDDGIYEIVTGRGNGISMFDASGNLLWDRPRINGDAVWGSLSAVRASVADLDNDGRLWIVAATQGYAIQVLDLQGYPRSGWPVPLTPGNVMNATPTLVDLDFDGKPEILAGDSHGHIFCYHGDGTACSGWPYVYQPGGDTTITFDLSPVIAFTGNDGNPYIVAVSDYIGPPAAIHVIDRFGQPVPPYPLTYPGFTSGDSYSIFEAMGTKWLAAGDNGGTNYMFDLTTGNDASGWPITGAINGSCGPAIGNIGQLGAAGLLFASSDGYGSTSSIGGYDISGTHLTGYPRTITRDEGVDTIALSTLDGINTTACWTAGTSSGSTGITDCFDVGVPWNRNNVQWGNYGFDLQHTSRFRRLWQINRGNTCVTIPSTEIPSDSGAPFDVTVCPRDASNALLGPDQELRFARRPILGQFVGPIRYDAATGNYRRTFQPPVQATAADIEFRVLVNEELDDTMPVVHLRARPAITSWSPDGVARGGAAVTITLTGTNYSPTPTVVAATPALVVQSFTVTGPGTINVTVIAPVGAAIGWSGLQVVSSAGERSNAAPIFVYDPAQVTLVATKPAGSPNNAKLEWFSGKGNLTIWTLERSATPDFAAKTQLYRGTSRTFTDTVAAAPIWYYRVQ